MVTLQDACKKKKTTKTIKIGHSFHENGYHLATADVDSSS